MITQLENEFGIISLNEKLEDSIIADALEPFKGRVWCADYHQPNARLIFKLRGFSALAKKDVFMGEKGIAVKVYVVFKFGVPMQEICDQIMSVIREKTENCLQMAVDHVEIHVTGTYSKEIVKRDIIFSDAKRHS